MRSSCLKMSGHEFRKKAIKQAHEMPKKSGFKRCWRGLPFKQEFARLPGDQYSAFAEAMAGFNVRGAYTLFGEFYECVYTLSSD